MILTVASILDSAHYVLRDWAWRTGTNARRISCQPAFKRRTPKAATRRDDGDNKESIVIGEDVGLPACLLGEQRLTFGLLQQLDRSGPWHMRRRAG